MRVSYLRFCNTRNKTAMKLAEFDSLKTSLLRDLQNRCEKVIDLEMLLDEAREQYEQLLKKSSNKSLQKRTYSACYWFGVY